MSDYEVEINRALKKETKDKTKIELWGKTTSRSIKKITNDRIWQKDGDEMFHDETLQLPVKVREDVDNVWIEKRGKMVDVPFNFYNIYVISYLVFSLTFLVFCSFWFCEIPKSWILTNRILFCI